MIERVFRYLKGIIDLKLLCTGLNKGGNKQEGYSDSNYSESKKSFTTRGYVIRLYGDSIAWKTRKLCYANLSTCEAKYVAMSNAYQEIISIFHLLKLMLTIH